MARATESRTGDPRHESSVPRSDNAAIVEALHQVRDLLTSATNELSQFRQTFEVSQDRRYETAVGVQINSWDDPFSEAVATVNPQIAAPIPLPPAVNRFARLPTSIVAPQPPAARYAP